MFYITGDTHCPIDIHKLNKKKFNDSNLSKSDYLIICGDVGLLWEGRDKEDKWWTDWLNQKKFTTLFIDGNHENHNKLDSLPVEIWNGGKVHKLRDSIIHLMRGQVYNIDGIVIFTMGGAESTDKLYRKENISWWERELPSDEEYNEALTNLDKVNWKVDYVISHTGPSDVLKDLDNWFNNNKLTNFLSTVNTDLEFKHWYFGHFHVDQTIKIKHTCLFTKILTLGNKVD